MAAAFACVATTSAAGAGGKTNGQACSGAGECASQYCVDGVCCEGACDETCVACSPLIGSTGKDGECRPVALGIDPKDSCQAEPPSSCGRTGVCDGKGACAVAPEQTPCGLSGACVEGVCVSIPLCDGDHTILGALGPVEECARFRCSEHSNRCLDRCATNQDCQPGYACSVDGACEAPIAADTSAVGCTIGSQRPRLGGLVWLVLLALRSVRRRERRTHAAPNAARKSC